MFVGQPLIYVILSASKASYVKLNQIMYIDHFILYIYIRKSFEMNNTSCAYVHYKMYIKYKNIIFCISSACGVERGFTDKEDECSFSSKYKFQHNFYICLFRKIPRRIYKYIPFRIINCVVANQINRYHNHLIVIDNELNYNRLINNEIFLIKILSINLTL